MHIQKPFRNNKYEHKNILKGETTMKHKPDDRSDNVENIQFNIDQTFKNYHKAEEMIEATDDDKTKANLEAKNERRLEALDGMREEIKDEARNRKQ